MKVRQLRVDSLVPRLNRPLTEILELVAFLFLALCVKKSIKNGKIGAIQFGCIISMRKNLSETIDWVLIGIIKYTAYSCGKNKQ